MTIKLSESNLIILETLMSEAVSHITERVHRGQSVSSAIHAVSEDMELNEYEISELQDRVKKKTIETDPGSKKTKQSNIVSEETTEELLPCSIYFENAEQSGQAIDLLMDRGIAWKSQGDSNNKPYVQFEEDKQLQHAQSVLRRRWDFVENEKRLVADVQFDNLSDYKKVLEFMRRQGMLLEFNGGLELDEDFDEVQNRKLVQKKIAEKEGRLYEEDSSNDIKSFVARSRTSSRSSKLDPVKESNHRIATVRKRWK